MEIDQSWIGHLSMWIQMAPSSDDLNYRFSHFHSGDFYRLFPFNRRNTWLCATELSGLTGCVRPECFRDLIAAYDPGSLMQSWEWVIDGCVLFGFMRLTDAAIKIWCWAEEAEVWNLWKSDSWRRISLGSDFQYPDGEILSSDWQCRVGFAKWMRPRFCWKICSDRSQCVRNTFGAVLHICVNFRNTKRIVRCEIAVKNFIKILLYISQRDYLLCFGHPTGNSCWFIWILNFQTSVPR